MSFGPPPKPRTIKGSQKKPVRKQLAVSGKSTSLHAKHTCENDKLSISRYEKLIDDLSSENSDFSKKLKEIQEKNELLYNLYKKTDSSLRELQDNFDKLEQKNKSIEKSLISKLKEIEILNQKCTSYEKQIDSLETLGNDKIEKKERKLEKLKDQISLLQSQVASLKESNIFVTNQNTVLKKNELKKCQFEEEINVLKIKYNDCLKEMGFMKEQYDLLKKENIELKDRMKNMNNAYKALSNGNGQLKQQHDACMMQLEDSQAHNTPLNKEIRVTNGTNESALNQVQNLETENMSLKKQIERFNDELKQVVKEKSELMESFEKEREEFLRQIEQMHANPDSNGMKKNQMKEEIDKLNYKLSEMERENIGLKKQLKESMDECNRIQKNNQMQLSDQHYKDFESERLLELSKQNAYHATDEVSFDSEMQKRSERFFSAIKTLKAEYNENRAKVIETEMVVNDLRRCSEDKEKLQKLVTEKEKQANDMATRLANEIGVKIGRNELNVENVSIKLRPTNIKENYQQLCSNTWHSAKEFIDEMLTNTEEHEKLKFLCDIIMCAYETCLTRFRGHMKSLHLWLYNPFKRETIQNNREEKGSKSRLTLIKADSLNSQTIVKKLRTKQTEKLSSAVKATYKTQREQEFKIPDMIRNIALDELRKTGDIVELSVLKDEITEVLREDGLFKTLERKSKGNDTPVVQYIDECTRITWTMVCQRPKMDLTTPGIGEPYNSACQEPCWGSCDPKSSNIRVACYKMPCLYHGDRLLCKGVVFLKSTHVKTHPRRSHNTL